MKLPSPATLWFVALSATSACGGHLRLDPDKPFPEQLSDLGLDTARDVLPYEPAWPLWTNGLDKERLLYVPAGETVDTRGGAAWDFPLGSALFKTFSWDGEPIETRALRRGGDGWEYATYLWDGEDATLLDPALAVEVDGIAHTVPATLDCRTCHEPGGGVIGLRDVQLRPEDARALASVLAPKGVPQVVDGGDPLTTEVLGYFVGNCIHCHDGAQGDQHSFDLRPDAALANVIGVPTDANATAPGTRVVPGEPLQSILFLAVSGEHDNPEIRSMPPLGVQRRDPEGIALLRAWIESLP